MRSAVPEKTIPPTSEIEGILLLNKPTGKTSFQLVATLRKKLGVRKIGHAGTLDPFATGVMVMLIGRKYTRMSDQFLCNDKEYVAEVKLGISTDSHDCDGEVISTSEIVPAIESLNEALTYFQGEIEQVPPMFSAKKVNGKKLYEMARKGQTVEREAVKIRVQTELLEYAYPFARIRVSCSKGTYIRCIAHELGQRLGCGGHLTALERTRSGGFQLCECLSWPEVQDGTVETLVPRLLSETAISTT